MHEILFMIRGRPRNGGDDVDVGIDVDDETRDEECSLFKEITFGLADLRSTGLERVGVSTYMTDFSDKSASGENKTEQRGWCLNPLSPPGPSVRAWLNSLQ